LLGNGICDEECNNTECENDFGDCEIVTPEEDDDSEESYEFVYIGAALGFFTVLVLAVILLYCYKRYAGS